MVNGRSNLEDLNITGTGEEAFAPVEPGISLERYWGYEPAEVITGQRPILRPAETRNVQVLPQISPPTIPEELPLSPEETIQKEVPSEPGLPTMRVPGLYQPQFAMPQYQPSRLEEIRKEFEGRRPRHALLGQLMGSIAGRNRSIYGPLAGYQPVQAQVMKEAEGRLQQEAQRAINVQSEIEDVFYQ